MPNFSVDQTSFNSGEVSPLVYGRVDSPRYKDALAKCVNYIPTLQGPLDRRPGSMYVTNVKDSTKPPVFIPFEFSATQAYMLEVGEFYIRFYSNGGQIVVPASNPSNVYQIQNTTTAGLLTFTATRETTNPMQGESNIPTLQGTLTSGQILELVTTYAYADLKDIRWAQKADTMYLVHPKYPPMKLQRMTNYSWTLKQVYFQDGPYLPYNSIQTLGDSVSIQLTPAQTSAAITTCTTGPSTVVTSTANNGFGQVRITTSGTHGYVTGQKVYIENVNADANCGVGTNPSSWPVQVVSSTVFDLIGSVYTTAFSGTGASFPALFTGTYAGNNNDLGLNNGRPISFIYSGKRYWGVIVAGVHAGKVVIYIDPSNPIPTTPTLGPATAWSLGVYSGYSVSVGNTPNPGTTYNGYPATVTFHQNRLVYGGAANTPQQIDGSAIGSYDSFAQNDPGTLQQSASNSYQFALASQDVNPIRWLKSNSQGLLAGTYKGEWVVTPSSQGEAITPTNVNATQSSNFGSAAIDAVQVGNAAIYIQRALRKVREMNYFWQAGTFRSIDLSELSEHITAPSVTKLAMQRETQPIVWAIRSDGALLSLVYDRTDTSLRAGWARHYLGGQSDSAGSPPVVLSMAVIPSPDLTFDQLWLVVQRWINGSKVVTIERLTNIFNSAMLQEDAFQGDCGFTYDQPITITGITNASPAVVTAAAHGFSNGDQVRFVGVTGLNKSTTDVDGNVTITNLVNEQTFVVAGATTNTFQLNDYQGNAFDSSAASVYVSGGQVRKMVINITGLTWLKNEKVSVLADGGIHPDVTVSNSGGITLQARAAKVQIGYSFNSDGQLMRPEAGSADGAAMGKTRRITRVAFLLNLIGDFLFGMDFNKLLPAKFLRADNQQADQAPPLYSGIHRDGIEAKYDFENQVCFRQNTMLPGTVQAVTTMGTEFDV